MLIFLNKFVIDFFKIGLAKQKKQCYTQTNFLNLGGSFMNNKYVKSNEIFAVIPKSRKNIKIAYKNGNDFYSVATDKKLDITVGEFKNVLIRNKIRMSYDALILGESGQQLGIITKLFSTSRRSFSASLPETDNKNIKIVLRYLDGADKDPYISKEDLIQFQTEYNDSLNSKKEITM